MQEAVVAHPTKSLGQDVLQHQPKEVLARQGSILGVAGGAVGVPESDLAVGVGDDVPLAEHAPVQIPGQVGQGGLAFADVLAMDHPLVGHRTGWGQAFGFQRLEETSPKHLGEGPGIEQVFGSGLFPLFSGRVHGAAGDDDVAVGMIVESPGVGMQDRGHADLAAEPLGVEAEVLEGTGGGGEQEAIHGFGVAPGEGSEGLGQGECDHEVVGGQQLGLLAG